MNISTFNAFLKKNQHDIVNNKLELKTESTDGLLCSFCLSNFLNKEWVDLRLQKTVFAQDAWQGGAQTQHLALVKQTA